MIRINEHYFKLQASYLFSNIAKRVNTFVTENPDKSIIRLGIGDVTRALPQACITAFHQAVDEMARDQTFRGYGPEQGYEFLRETIATADFQSKNADISADEIFVSDGAKCDTGNIQELFSTDITIAIPDPVYPVYLDTNVMAGRTGDYADGRFEGIVYLDSTKDNNFIPDLPQTSVDLIYLCFPNNPTGATISRDGLKKWVDYARKNKALILFDAAYMRPSSGMSRSPKAFTRSRGRKRWPLNFAVSQKPPDLPVPVALTPWCPKNVWLTMRVASPIPCTTYGTAARAPNSTVSPIRCRRPQKPCTRTMAKPRSKTWWMPT